MRFKCANVAICDLKAKVLQRCNTLQAPILMRGLHICDMCSIRIIVPKPQRTRPATSSATFPSRLPISLPTSIPPEDITKVASPIAIAMTIMLT